MIAAATAPVIETVANPTWMDILSSLAGAIGVVIAAAIPVTAYLRRPKVTLVEDRGNVHSRVEGAGHPFVRLLVRNGRGRRSANETKVLLDHYQPRGGDVVTLGCPMLAWTSHFEDLGPTIFSSWERPIDLGELVQMQAAQNHRTGHTNYHGTTGGTWHLNLALGTSTNRLILADDRHILPPQPNGYTFRVTAGASDSAGRTYLIDVNWDGGAATAESALQSIQMAIRNP